MIVPAMKIFAYSVPAILIVLGWCTIVGDRIAEVILGTSPDPILGYFMMGTGILIYIGRIFIIR